jgi:hypothetical protein
MVLVPAQPEVAGRRWRRSKLAETLGDVGLVLLFGALLPFAILAVGTPIALLVLVLIEVVNRF